MSTPERIAKRLARAGLCSRREAERWIAEGRVAVDGQVLETPAVLVSDASEILVDGQPIPDAERPRAWRYHKPQGLVTTHDDPQGRPTVFASLPEDLPRVISVGRLDLVSEGLLLLTNSGALARYLELPTTGWIRRYRVRVHGRVDADRLGSLAAGVVVDGVRYGPVEAVLERQQGANAWLAIALAEGKNREVRKLMQHLGYTVNRLIRVAYGPFQLGALKPGEVSPVSARVLREQIGADAAREIGLEAEGTAAPRRSDGKSAGKRPADARADGRRPSRRQSGDEAAGPTEEGKRKRSGRKPLAAPPADRTPRNRKNDRQTSHLRDRNTDAELTKDGGKEKAKTGKGGRRVTPSDGRGGGSGSGRPAHRRKDAGR